MDSRRPLFQLLGDCTFVQPSLLDARQRLPALLGCCICRDNAQCNIFVDAMTACTALLGLARALQGHFRESLPEMEKNEACAPEIRIFNTSTATIALGTVRLLAGKADEATEMAAHAAESAAEHGFRGSQARISHLLGDICARREPPDVQRAEQHYRQAMNLAEELDMRPLVAQCHLSLGRLHRRMAHLKQAAENFRAMDMPFWLQQAEGQLEELKDGSR